jgi:DNA modification methylase
MPELSWKSKNKAHEKPAELNLVSLLYPGGEGYPHSDERTDNQVILGDNLAVMKHLLPEYEEGIDLIYADPPFFTNRKYPTRTGVNEDSRKPSEWQLSEGYEDDWEDLNAYLDMLYPRLDLMYRLLSPSGTLYLHLDWHANSYARILLDEIFGPNQLLNEIIWIYHGPSPIKTAFNRKHDTILVYTKSKKYTFNADAVREPYDPSTVRTFNSSPKAGFGKMPNLKRGKVPEDWWYFPVVARLHNERTGYPTQKPEALLERVIKASSRPGDLVADFFSGSGTTAVVTERLGRRFIAVDNSWRAFHVTRKRLAKSSSSPAGLFIQSNLSTMTAFDSAHFKIKIEDGKISLDGPLTEDIDFWEVDPNWNGKVFKSVAQGSRGRKANLVPHALEIPQQVKIDNLCVRIYDVGGGRYKVEENGK